MNGFKTRVASWKLRHLTLCLCFLVDLASESRLHAFTNGLALTPPMGFNPWYQCTGLCDERYVKACADAIATNGMKAAGYQYINIDDCWFSDRDANGKLVVDSRRF